jgi:hypothetical protein
MAYEAVTSAVRMLTNVILASDTVADFNRLCGLADVGATASLDNRPEMLFESQKAFDVSQGTIINNPDGVGRPLVCKYFEHVIKSTISDRDVRAMLEVMRAGGGHPQIGPK